MKSEFARTPISLVRKFSLVAAAAMLPIMAFAAIPPAERLLPVDTLLVFCAPEASQLREACDHSPTGQLFNDPAMKPFRDKFVEKWKEEFVVPLERELGMKLNDYSALLQGQFTLAITQNGWEGKQGEEPAILMLLDTREKSSLLKTNLTELRKKWVDSGKTFRTETVRGVELWVVPMSSNNIPLTLQKYFPQRQEVQEKGKEDDPEPASKDELVIGQYESLLIVGDSVKAVERVVARLTGGSIPALADEAAFVANQSAQFRNAQMFVWFNAKRLFDILLAIPEAKPNPEAPSPFPQISVSQTMKTIGFGGLKTVAAALRMNSEGSGIDLLIGAPDSTRTGILKILATEAKDSSPPPFVPADVLNFQRWRLDGQETIATIEKMLSDFSPQALSVWNLLISTGDAAGKENDPDFDLRKNLLSNLGEDFISYTKPPRGNTPQELTSPPGLLLIGSPNPDKFAASIRGLLAIISSTVEPQEREFLGRKIYTVTLSRTPLFMPRLARNKLSYTASGNYVALTDDATILEEYIRSSENPPKPLRELPGLLEAAQKVGGQSTGLFNYENQAEKWRIKFQLLKTNSDNQSDNTGIIDLLTIFLPFARPQLSMKEWVDYSLLPDFDKVSKYFHFSIYSSKASSQGITYKFFVPTPPELK